MKRTPGEQRFPRRTVARPHGEPGLPPEVSDLDAFREELDAIGHRIDKVVARGRAAFRRDSDSYDNASIALIRLAALFEDDDRFLPLLSPVTDEERRGIVTTRNIVSHRGYRTMDAGRFWSTITTDVPDLLRRIRQHHGIT